MITNYCVCVCVVMIVMCVMVISINQCIMKCVGNIIIDQYKQCIIISNDNINDTIIGMKIQYYDNYY